MPAQHAEGRRAIESALLDFRRAPGRHKLHLRQPALLFASMREVLQLAAARSPDRDTRPPATIVIEAARFFVRAALLQPHADHYALLGLPQDAPASDIKERYRALMRLMHPDFARSSAHTDWPADAASRINRAYEVLSSAERRRAYDESIAPPPAREIANPPAPSRPRNPPRPARRGASRRILGRLAAGFGALGALATAAMWASSATNDRETLVQRATSRANGLPALLTAAASAVQHTSGSWGAGGELTLPAENASPVVIDASGISTAPTPAPAPAVAVALAVPPPHASIDISPAGPMAVDALPSPAADATPSAVALPSAAAAAAPAIAPAAPAIVATLSPRPAAARAGPPAGLTMADVQPALTRLLREMESGWGDNLLSALDGEARTSTGAQALARQLDALSEGVRPVKVARVDLKGEPRDGHLVVSGVVMLQVRDTSTRQLALQAEFAAQQGGPVLTRLAPLALP